MKYLPHIGFPLLMVVLLGGAMVLPKFVKKPKTPSEMAKEVEDLTYDEMKQMLHEAGVDTPEVTVVEPVAETVDAPAPIAAAPEITAPAEPEVPKVSIDEQLAPFFAAVEAGKLNDAQATLKSLGDEIPSSMIKGLEITLSTAEAAQKQLQENQKKLAATNAELESSQSRFSAMEKESMARIESTVKTLEAATKAAEKAAIEAASLREEMASAGSSIPESKPDPKPNKDIKLPETVSVTFNKDSSALSGASEKSIDSVISELKKESGLDIQLRGYADTSGDAEYNAILSRARAEVVRDWLVKGGVDAERIDVISFGESTAELNATGESLRRVDLLFRKN